MHCGLTSGQYSSTFAQVLAPYWNFEYTKVITSGRWYRPRSCNWGSWTEVKSTSMQWLHLPYLCNFQSYSTLNHAMLVWCLLSSCFFLPTDSRQSDDTATAMHSNFTPYEKMLENRNINEQITCAVNELLCKDPVMKPFSHLPVVPPRFPVSSE